MQQASCHSDCSVTPAEASAHCRRLVSARQLSCSFEKHLPLQRQHQLSFWSQSRRRLHTHTFSTHTLTLILSGTLLAHVSAQTPHQHCGTYFVQCKHQSGKANDFATFASLSSLHLFSHFFHFHCFHLQLLTLVFFAHLLLCVSQTKLVIAPGRDHKLPCPVFRYKTLFWKLQKLSFFSKQKRAVAVVACLIFKIAKLKLNCVPFSLSRVRCRCVRVQQPLKTFENSERHPQ